MVALREILPSRRQAETFKLAFGWLAESFQVTLGYYEDGRLGEVFISSTKQGSTMDALVHDAAVLLSIALQYGVPLDTLKHAVGRDGDANAATIIGAVLDRVHEIQLGLE